MGRLSATTKSALLRLHNGYVIHKRSFEALCDHGYAEVRNRTEQHITDAGRAFLNV
jgi:hypothetical protein